MPGCSPRASLALAFGLFALISTAPWPALAAPPASGAVSSPSADHIGPVRNLAAQPGEEIVTIRYWKIKKGSFPEFLKASETGVWPYFEKIGARVVGMWEVIPAPGSKEASADYDEVYLTTRYASLDHWAATRDAAKMGGDGADYKALQAALAVRRSLTIETRVTFLKGLSGPLPPVFLPGTGEAFVPKRSVGQ
ncbi:MAG: hypothetical protein GC155_10710 [Alphaproteobacteria bacterium]|nr:hypothetical protein [Alphaproteobacteria bacterium]